MKILILKPSSLGDVVQAMPVLRLLKLHQPGHQVFWWISAELADLLQGDPDLSGLFLFHRHGWGTLHQWRELAGSIRSMRAHQFDCVIDLQALARSGCVAWLASGARTIGLEDWREGSPVFYDWAVPRPSPLTHAVDWYLQVLQALAVPVHFDFTWLPPRPHDARRVRTHWNPGPGRWIILSPGARWANKRWPAEYYAEVVQQLMTAHPDLSFAILGGPGDAPLGAAIARLDQRRCLDLTGQTSLGEMIEWIRLSELVVTNDTGPMHIAAALGKKIVAVFGPTEPRRTGPYGQVEETLRTALPCAPCLRPRCHYEKPIECLRAIPPWIVRNRIEQLLAVEYAPPRWRP